jgi:fructose-bisphosphate aldolase class 1
LTHAEWAWSLEFSTGRALRHAPPHAWRHLRDRVEAAYRAHQDIALVLATR